MTIALSGELNRLVEKEMATGNYNSADEVLLAAVRLLRDRQDRLAALRNEIVPALERFDRGEGQPLDMEATKAEARRRFERTHSI